jgi:hypothetical protein
MRFESTAADQAARATSIAIIRMKAIEAFRRHGLEVRRIDATTLGADSGVRFPLENLLAECHEMGRPLWDEVIDVHTRYMVEATRETDPSELSDEEFLAKVRERVVAPSLLAALDEYAYSRPLIDGIADAPRRALGLSYPGRTLLLADRHLADRDLDTACLLLEGRRVLAGGRRVRHRPDRAVRPDVGRTRRLVRNQCPSATQKTLPSGSAIVTQRKSPMECCATSVAPASSSFDTSLSNSSVVTSR